MVVVSEKISAIKVLKKIIPIKLQLHPPGTIELTILSDLSHSHFPFRTSKQAVEEQKRIESQLAGEVETARQRISEINAELESVVEQLGEAKVSVTDSKVHGTNMGPTWVMLAPWTLLFGVCYINGWGQDCGIYSTLAMELLLSCVKLWIIYIL